MTNLNDVLEGSASEVESRINSFENNLNKNKNIKKKVWWDREIEKTYKEKVFWYIRYRVSDFQDPFLKKMLKETKKSSEISNEQSQDVI